MSNTHEDVLKDTTHPPIVQHRDPPNSETGTCTEELLQGDNIKVKEYEKPSYIHGAKDALAGTVKVIKLAKKDDQATTVCTIRVRLYINVF